MTQSDNMGAIVSLGLVVFCMLVRGTEFAGTFATWDVIGTGAVGVVLEFQRRGWGVKL